MPVHVAILQPPYPELILRGKKTIESRLTRAASPPFEQVRPGERIFFKRSGGPFVAAAIAEHVEHHRDLTPHDITRFQARLNHRILGNDAYWQAKHNSRYATFITLRDVTPATIGPHYPKNPYRAWFVLPDEADPVLEVELTHGALRNRYVGVGGRPDFFGSAPFTLALPDGNEIETRLFASSRIRWRGWGELFQSHRLTPGDRACFVPDGPARYRVVFRRDAPYPPTSPA